MPRIKDLPFVDRPREKALRFGIETLSDVELLALIIQSGGKDNSAIDIANEILKGCKKEDLIFQSMNYFLSIKGISKVKALHLSSIFEFVRRYETALHGDVYNVFNIHEIAKKYRFHFMKKKQEELIILVLDNKNRIIVEKSLYKGNNDQILIKVEEILEIMKVNNGKGICLIHNHPSGEVVPSYIDELANQEIISSLVSNGFKYIDHLIIGEENYYSFNELRKIFY